jgi:hypothetical protein
MVYEMKKDEVFKAVFGQLHFQGGTYEKLRVGSPDEFDINLELRLPVDYAELKVCMLCYIVLQFNIFQQLQVHLTIQLQLY